jgi:hypothetical protein
MSRSLSNGGERAMVVSVDDAQGVIEELLQPENPDRVALVLEAARTGDVVDLVQAISDPARVGALNGNVALVSADGSVRTLDTAVKHTVGSRAVLAAIQINIRRNWIGFGLALLAGALGFAQLKRAWMRRQEA